ncbi:MAG: AMP-binding protein, partial [Succinivibrio sp.]
MASLCTPWYESYPSDVPHTIDPHLYDNINLMFDDVCKRYSANRAYISFNCSISYNDLSKKVDAFASYLQHDLKVKKGDRLAIILPNLIQYPVAVFAGLKCGMEIVNINPLYTKHEILGVLRDCKAEVVVALETLAANLIKISDQTYLKHIVCCSVGGQLTPLKKFFVNFAVRHIKKLVPKYDHTKIITMDDSIKRGIELPFEQVIVDFDDIAFLQYTGGTTGKPKGAMLSHGNILSNVAQCIAMYGPILKRDEEVMLTALPLYHIFAMSINMMFAFYIGGANLLIPDARNFKALVSDMKANPDISIITGVNTLFNAFVVNEVYKKVELKKLRLVVGGGTAVQEGVANRFKESFGLSILEGYGLTECSPLCCVVPYTNIEYNGTIGIPTPSTLARIVDIETGEEIRDLERSGELEFKGPQVMKGYFNNELETENVFHDGWLRTGDIAMWCEGGYIRIIDRIKDLIIVSGFNVFPSEIENVVSHNDRVLECAVVGVPSKSTGESIKLYIVKRDSTLTREDIIAYCKEYLTGYKMPKHIEFVDTLPKSPVGKVMRRFL